MVRKYFEGLTKEVRHVVKYVGRKGRLDYMGHSLQADINLLAPDVTAHGHISLHMFCHVMIL